jgi:multisubunit Na+/H+ antiporter MnhF subunit
VISRLETAVSLAMLAFLACIVFSWDTGTPIASALFLVLVAAFAARTIYRKSRGQSWQEAWGRTPAPE